MSATRRVSDLGIGRAHHHGQKMPLPQTRLCRFLAAAYITQQDELCSDDRAMRDTGVVQLRQEKAWGKISNDKRGQVASLGFIEDGLRE